VVSDVDRAPQYTIDVRAWKADATVASGPFKVEIPADAKKVRA